MVSIALIMGIFSGLEKVGKQSGKLSQLFSAMKEASGVTQVYNTAMEMLNQEVSAASMDSVRELVEIISDPDFEPIISAVAYAFKAFAALIIDIWNQLKPYVGIWRLIGIVAGEVNENTIELQRLIDQANQALIRLPDGGDYIFH